jgi:hypothetical protein
METIGADLQRVGRIPLADAHVEEGEIEVVNPYTDERHLPATLGPTQFMGEIAFLNGGARSMAMRCARASRDRSAAGSDADLDVSNPSDVRHHYHGICGPSSTTARLPR